MQKTKKELYDALMKKTEELDQMPSFEQVRLDLNMPDPNEYAYFFGSFTNAVGEVWQAYTHSRTMFTKKEGVIQAKRPTKRPAATISSATMIPKKPKWQMKPERVEEIRNFYLNYFIKHNSLPTFVDAEKAVRMTRDELSFMRQKFLLEKSYFVREATRITGKEYPDPWLEYNQNSIIANQLRREREALEKQSENAPIG